MKDAPMSLGSRLGRKREQSRQALEAYAQGQAHTLSVRQRVLIMGPLFISLVVREFGRDNTATQAAGLAFVSVLSIIPTLSVITALLGAYGLFDALQGSLTLYASALLPVAGAEIAKYLTEFSAKGASSIGGISGVTLLVISILLFNTIERALTNIWQGPPSRPLISKFLMFYTMITLGPILLILSIVQTASAQLFFSQQLGLDVGAMGRVLPFFYALVVFTLGNKILPHAHVNWSAALVGGVATAGGFELAKWGFNQYVNIVIIDSYNKLYGALGLIPIFMIWVYVTWLVILVGSEIAYCFQHMDRLVREAPLQRVFDRELHRTRRMSHPLVCLEVLAPVVSAFAQGLGPLHEARIVQLTGYDPDLVREVLDGLLRREVLVVSGRARGNMRLLMPARPLESIALDEVLRPFLRAPSAAQSDTLQTMREGYIEGLLALVRGRDAGALVYELEAAPEDRMIERLERWMRDPVAPEALP